ncbi:MAG: hypothetical protein HRT94_02005 [Alphaproteobacteria bacterium]|nr:hypothetical protein [Alphaproteobacteria bacterium]
MPVKYLKVTFLFGITASLVMLSSIQNSASAKCSVDNKLCIMEELQETAKTIENKSWRDKTYRELAKSYTYEGYPDKAIALIDKIETPDTKAMTIRGIGFAAADSKWPTEKYAPLFEKLTAKADQIEHPPSQAIAYTYVAMAQAFAKDDVGAMATAKAMTNGALRHKAFAETAEIQAERGDFTAAFESIKQIDSEAFKNKAYSTVAKIFTKQGQLAEAYSAAQNITNTYNRTQILQQILNKGNPEEEMPSTSGN